MNLLFWSRNWPGRRDFLWTQLRQTRGFRAAAPGLRDQTANFGEVKVLSNDFIRDGKQSPSDKGKYVGINRDAVDRALGRELSDGVYDVKVVRNGRFMYTWRENPNYCTEGNTVGRRQPNTDQTSDDWEKDEKPTSIAWNSYGDPERLPVLYFLLEVPRGDPVAIRIEDGTGIRGWP